MAPQHQLAIAGTRVEVEELGAGQHVAVVQTALSIDEMAPLARELSRDFRVWHVHRPGYGANGPALAPGSVVADADLVASVLRRLDLGPWHVVGASYSAAVVLTLAVRHPEVVRSLVVVEPPPYGTAGAHEFRAVNERIVETGASLGALQALDDVMQVVDGPDWRVHAERDLPGSVASMERDAAVFVEVDVPALLEWTFDDEHAAGVGRPTLLVGGAESHRWFSEMLSRLERTLPMTTRVTIDGAGHSGALTHHAEVAEAIVGHVRSVSPTTGGERDSAGRS